MTSKALKARIADRDRKRRYLDQLDDMTDNQVAGEVAHWECVNGKPGSFAAWALGQATAELDHRI